jgi:hypothetical protein
MPAGLPRPSERRINGARSLSAGPARQRPPLLLLTTLHFFADFFLYFGFVVLVSVAVFRQIETRRCGSGSPVVTASAPIALPSRPWRAEASTIFCVPEGGRGKDHSEDHQVCSRNDCS